MRRGALIKAVATKRLSRVDLPHLGSNQHEIGGVKALRDLLGTAGLTRREVEWVGLRAGDMPVRDAGSVTFSDVRRNNPNRAAEWHLYYTGNFLADYDPGDAIWFALLADGSLIGVVVEAGSEWEIGCAELFGVKPDSNRGGFREGGPELRERALGFAASRVASSIGLDEPVTASAEMIVDERFPDGFPTTLVLSAVARETAPIGSGTPDELLEVWYRHEQELFAALERRDVSARIESGFVVAGAADVKSFLSFSIGVQNRRKSRAGAAFEHHLAEIFNRSGLQFERGARTEHRCKPDFLFPNTVAYHDPMFEDSRLRMLGAKTTCKERWRQVLSEAARINHKHLCTMQEGLSGPQMDEMKGNNLTLVVPASLHEVFPRSHRSELMTIAGFIEEVSALQR